MIPLCLVLGDSTAVGTAQALAARGIQCEVHARVGAPSAETLRTWRGGGAYAVALIAVGSNDPTNPALLQNLWMLRRRTTAARVSWLAPYDARAARVVAVLARTFGDTVIPLSVQPSRDHVHPASYQPIASALAWNGAAENWGGRWRGWSARPPRTAAEPASTTSADPRAKIPGGVAVVLSAQGATVGWSQVGASQPETFNAAH